MCICCNVEFFVIIAESSWLDEPFQTCDVANKIDASLWVIMEDINNIQDESYSSYTTVCGDTDSIMFRTGFELHF